MNKNVLIISLLSSSIMAWASSPPSNNAVLKSDFKLPTHHWTAISSNNLPRVNFIVLTIGNRLSFIYI